MSATDETALCILKPLDGGDDVVFASVLRIGRESSNELVLATRRASAQHARLEWRADRWYLRDLASTNGTTVNGRWVQGLQALSVGDEIRFAGVVGFQVERLVPPLVWPTPGESETEEGDEGQAWEITRLELAPIPPESGAIRFRTAAGEREVRADLPFHLLMLLAAEPGVWMKDDDLRAALWGRDWWKMHRNTYLEVVRVLRRILSRIAIDKERGRTCLNLPPEVVVVLREPSGGVGGI